MKLNTKRTLLTAAGLLLSASNALADSMNTSSSGGIISHLGMFSTVANTLLSYAEYIAFFACILALLFLLASSGFGKAYKKIETAVNAKEGLKNWLIESVLVVLAFIVLFDWVIPTVDGFIRGGV